ncbi:MAG: hypothetical protein QXI32_04320 [Candidatus Bathyarchaeia archaeon]
MLTLLLPCGTGIAYAATPSGTPKGWTGTQIVTEPGNPSDFGSNSTHIWVTIIGIEMSVIRGYDFGDIEVCREIITKQTIIIPLVDLISKSIINIYDYPHIGSFKWYDLNGNEVGQGTFEKGSGPPFGGSLSATLNDGTAVTGIYRVSQWMDIEIQISNYGLTRVIRVPVMLNHAGVYVKQSS